MTKLFLILLIILLNHAGPEAWTPLQDARHEPATRATGVPRGALPVRHYHYYYHYYYYYYYGFIVTTIIANTYYCYHYAQSPY